MMIDAELLMTPSVSLQMTPFCHSNNPTADRISNLPDEILCHILSFLPTKHAATTSVLSKRWKPVWLLVLTLDLDEETFKDSVSFLRAMHTIIFLRDITLPVHSFRFKCSEYSSYNQIDINQIVNFALRGLQKLYLHMNKYSCSGIELPQSIFSCRTLEILKLNDLKVRDISHLVDLHLPSLKVLHMTNVSFRRHEHLEKLLLGCPILEDLETINSFHMQELKLEKLKALPNLIRARICEWYIPISLVSKAKILSVVPFIWTCLLQLRHSLDSTLSVFQCLTHLEVSFTYDINFFLRGKWLWLIGILKYSPKLQKLIIQDCEDVKLEESYNGCWKVKEPAIIVPECLLSQLKTCYLISFKGTKCGFEFAKFIIENSKVLDYMVINSKFSRDIDSNSKMLMKLSSCTKGSATCKLVFD